ncbi:hypothetical protein ACVWZ3_000938 [Bradyrhizobium sp. i1.3.6]
MTRVRSAIDVVAEEDLDRAKRPAVRHVRIDHGEHLLEQMRAAVDIADRIDAHAVR